MDRKKIQRLLIGMVMLIGLIWIGTVTNVSANTSGNYTYDIKSDGTIKITGYTGTETNLTLPNKIENKVVSEIGYNAFYHKTNLKTIQIPSNVKSIGSYAFADCTNLTSITLAEGIREIHNNAFEYNTSLITINIPKSIEYIGEDAFYACSKLKVTIPSTLKKLENGIYKKLVATNVQGVNHYDYANEVVKLVNNERKKNGLSELTMDAGLLDAAMLRAAETAILFEHTRPCGEIVFSIHPNASGENIASGSLASPSSAFNAWMSSEGHRKNILTERYHSIGVGCFKKGNSTYWVQLFSSSEADSIRKTGQVTVNPTVLVDLNLCKLNVTGIANTNTMNVGQTKQISVQIESIAPVQKKDITFSSSNTKVCSIDSNGKVTAKARGDATIKVKVGSTVKAYKVTVRNPGEYVGNINSELQTFTLDKNVAGAHYVNGKIVVVEWVNGKSTVPKVTPKMRFKSTDGKVNMDVFVTPTGTNTYYFDRFIEGIDMSKQYYFEVSSGDSRNVSTTKTMNVYFTASKFNNKSIGIYRNYKIILSNQNIKFVKDTYVGNINSELQTFTLDKNTARAHYVSGKIVVVEWVNGKSTVPKVTPKMRFKSTDGKVNMDVFVTPTGTNTYYFDRFIEGIDMSKQYYFEVSSGDSRNVSTTKTMNVYFTASKFNNKSIGTYRNKKITLTGTKIIFK